LDLDLVTSTLRYNRMHWITIDGLAEHWSQASISASIASTQELEFESSGVTDVTFSFRPGAAPFDLGAKVLVITGEQELEAPGPRSDKSWSLSLHKIGGDWRIGPRPAQGVRKKHGLSGPIDDAFMDSFLFVRPTGKAANPAAGEWAAGELTRAIEHWRRHFRGQARVKDDTAVTADDIAGANLVLWGDPSSNAVLKKIAGQLPIRWDDKHISVGGQTFGSDKHALIAIYPNPLHPARYVVLNSSFTFRDYAYLNNARQVPMLPDWAVVDLTTPPGNVWPGKIVAADFFDEQWQLK
jgi:hypothetical protein